MCYFEELLCKLCLKLYGAKFDSWDVKEHFCLRPVSAVKIVTAVTAIIRGKTRSTVKDGKQYRSA